MKEGYSDRVWCTLLWECMQFAKRELQSSGSEEDHVDTQLLPQLMLKFLRENSSILAPDSLAKWVHDRQCCYADEDLIAEAYFEIIPK